MGNKCLISDVDRRSARKALDAVKDNQHSTPLTFNIRSWPRHQFINLTQTDNCIQKNVGVCCNQSQKMDFTLQSCPETNTNTLSPIDNKTTNFVLHCQIQNKIKYVSINFPIKEERDHVWRFIREWTDFDEQDILRMGRTKYRLCKLVEQNNASEVKSIAAISAISATEGAESRKCRICLSKKQTPEDPLISPCKCTGSVQFTHLYCLSKWLFSLNINDNQYINVRKNKSICQICKTDITGTAEYQKMADLLFSNLQDIPTPYAVLQNTEVQLDEQSNNYFVLCFKNKDTYTIGRSTKANIVDKNDKCISKIHSQIKYSNGRLIVRDCESLHGTMMQVKSPLKLYTQNLSEDVAYHNMLIKAVYAPKKND